MTTTSPAPTSVARVWLRLDNSKPASFSVRFSVRNGVGYLHWSTAVKNPERSAAASGTAGGLEAVDLVRLLFFVRPSGSSEWLEFRIVRGSVPTAVLKGPREWHLIDLFPIDHGLDECEVESGPAQVVSEETLDLDQAEIEERPTALEDAADPDSAPIALSGDPDSVADEEVPLSEPSDTRGAQGGALVRSLVQRIRRQDAEITALKQRIAELEAGVRR